MQEDETNLHVTGRGLTAGVLLTLLGRRVPAAAGGQAQRHHQGEDQRKKLLHSTFLLLIHSDFSNLAGNTLSQFYHTGSMAKIQL